MYNSQQSNGRFSNGQTADPSLSHKVDIICLAILVYLLTIQFVGFFSCLIRSDYNFAIIFFCYFVWQQRKDTLALKIILAATIVLFIFDLIFVFTEVRVWFSEDPNNPIWQNIRPMHNFGFFCWILIIILKIILAVFTGKGISNMGKAVQPY